MKSYGFNFGDFDPRTENVYNLMTLEKGNCIKKIRQLFEDIGYNVNYKKLKQTTTNYLCTTVDLNAMYHYIFKL